jgi:TatD DNase family protein
MSKKIKIPEPDKNLKFIDVHCHLGSLPRPKNDKLPTDDDQLSNYFNEGGLYLINSTIDNHTLKLTLRFLKDHDENYGFTCGWAPQTVTYTPRNLYNAEWKQWIDFVKNNNESYLAIGEVGLDFHHAKTLDKRNKQVAELKKIFEHTRSLNKPYVLHVRNAAEYERDKQHPNHRFNKADGATQEILRILKQYRVDPSKVMWHCFSGPESYVESLAKDGHLLSVPSSAYGFNRWRKVTKYAPLESLVTETDSYYQHPYLRGPVNTPANVKYAIAALSYSHGVSQQEVSEKTVENALKFFNISFERQ